MEDSKVFIDGFLLGVLKHVDIVLVHQDKIEGHKAVDGAPGQFYGPCKLLGDGPNDEADCGDSHV